MSRLSKVVLAVVALGGVSAGPALAATPPSASTQVTSTVVAVGDKLGLKTGNRVQPYDFTGINAYQLASNWGVNYGCGWGGWNPSIYDAFFSQVKPNQLIRTWAFQYLATNRYTGQPDFTALDQVVAAADAAHAHLILTLSNQDGTCDDSQWKDSSWYAGGYAQAFNPYGSTPYSYLTYVTDIVKRYAGNPAIAMWEPMNEPQPAACSVGGRGNGPSCWGNLSCPNEALTSTVMYNFFTTIGGLIHRLDPGHLVSDGSLGGQECGYATNADFRHVISSPGIDVVGYHDYSGMVALPADLTTRVQEANAVHKPTMIGEAGIFSCANATVEAQEFKAKINAALAAGVSAYLPWRYDYDGGNPQCNGIINFGSPTMDVIDAAAHAVVSPPATVLHVAPSAVVPARVAYATAADRHPATVPVRSLSPVPSWGHRG